MKVRLAILVIGVLLGLVYKWGLTGWVDAESSLSSQDDTKAPIGGEENPTYVDPLVPPANVFNPSDPGPAILPMPQGDFTADERALFEPHGDQVCASGCAVSRHPTKELAKTAYRRLLEQFLREPISEDSPALESLLFFGRQTQQMIAEHGIGPLDSERAEVLQKELTRTHAKITIRVVDENGVVRSSLPWTSVPLDRRHVFSMNVNKVQPLVTSGTVKRVGLHHLWTRL